MADTVTALASNGHLMAYSVRAVDTDGAPILSQHDAEHSDRCPCIGTDEEDPTAGQSEGPEDEYAASFQY